MGMASQLDRSAIRSHLNAAHELLDSDPDAAERELQTLGDLLRASARVPAERALACTAQTLAAPAPRVDNPMLVAVAPRAERPEQGSGSSVQGALRLLAVCFAVSLPAATLMHAVDPGLAVLHDARALIRSVALWPALAVPYWAVRRCADPRAQWPRWLRLQLPGLLLFLVLLGAIEHALGSVVIAIARLDVPAPTFAQVLQAELRYGSNTYVAAVGFWTAIHFRDQRRAAARRSAELSSIYNETRLVALAAGLDPHFLHNALNTIGSLFYSDPPRARRLMESFKALFDTLLEERQATWTVAQERAHLSRYVDFVHARFEERILVDTYLPAALDSLEMPRFALQGLVENAVKHNQHERRPLFITVRGQRTATRLHLAVSDDGCGFARGTGPCGGLLRLEQTLALLYGNEASLTVEAPPRGAQLNIILPARGEIAWSVQGTRGTA